MQRNTELEVEIEELQSQLRKAHNLKQAVFLTKEMKFRSEIEIKDAQIKGLTDELDDLHEQMQEIEQLNLDSKGKQDAPGGNLK